MHLKDLNFRPSAKISTTPYTLPEWVPNTVNQASPPQVTLARSIVVQNYAPKVCEISKIWMSVLANVGTDCTDSYSKPPSNCILVVIQVTCVHNDFACFCSASRVIIRTATDSARFTASSAKSWSVTLVLPKMLHTDSDVQLCLVSSTYKY